MIHLYQLLGPQAKDKSASVHAVETRTLDAPGAALLARQTEKVPEDLQARPAELRQLDLDFERGFFFF